MQLPHNLLVTAVVHAGIKLIDANTTTESGDQVN